MLRILNFQILVVAEQEWVSKRKEGKECARRMENEEEEEIENEEEEEVAGEHLDISPLLGEILKID